MEGHRLFAAVVLAVAFFGGSALFWYLSGAYRHRNGERDDLAVIYTGCFAVAGMLLVPFMLYESRVTWLERDAPELLGEQHQEDTTHDR